MKNKCCFFLDIESLGEWDWYCMKNIVRVVFCKSQEAIEFIVVRNWILNDQSIWDYYRLLHFNNQSIFFRSNGYLLHFFHCFFFILQQNFVVRGSSQSNTMAVSVRLPPDTGPYIEHYLILSENGVLSLESSRFEFSSIPALIDHYAKCW